MPNSVTHLNRTIEFEWYVVRCGFKNGCQKDMCSEEIRPHAQNLITI